MVVPVDHIHPPFTHDLHQGGEGGDHHKCNNDVLMAYDDDTRNGIGVKAYKVFTGEHSLQDIILSLCGALDIGIFVRPTSSSIPSSVPVHTFDVDDCNA